MEERSESQTLYNLQKVDIMTSATPQQTRKEPWGKLLTLVGLAATFGSAVPVGYCIGGINSPASYMRAWCNETLVSQYDFHITSGGLDILWSAIVSIFLVGGAIGSLGGAGAADKFGRKGCFLISGILFVFGAILFLFCRLANSVEMLLIGRFLVGLASGLTTASVPMYLSECAPLTLRGALGVCCSMGVTGGVVVGQVFNLRNIFGTPDLWHYGLSFYVVLVIVCYLPSYYFPESPKWLYIVKHDREAAKRELRRLRGANQMAEIQKEIEDMEIEANAKMQTSSFVAVLRDSSLALPLIIVCAYQGGQQLTGINAIFYYSVSIFERAGLSAADAEWANLGAGCLNLLTSFLSPYLMANVNRRPLMQFSCFSCAIFLLAFAFVLRFIDFFSWFAIAGIVCIFCYIFFYQIGVGPIPYFIGSEIFEVAPRPIGMAMGSLSSWSCNFIIGMTFPSLQNAWGAFVFIPFSVTCFLMFLLTRFYLPETRGRDPKDVASLISKGFRSKVR